VTGKFHLGGLTVIRVANLTWKANVLLALVVKLPVVLIRELELYNARGWFGLRGFNIRGIDL